ncbi:PREDICTED: clp protease-related protein At4g12060, chloroplastic [Fragaria vesca subsp. vesca]|uniref:clp protease-related protein At4g12060, chloroplastic n=1 Tax=Fragaria vesca subsp. vesca TaxID=101020 RepID=UPI0002C364DE|nr:PREDICTED: clp protease-related protein At4g12060, chloroplastic [Fragaria vesca subsp. vesca]
MAAHSFSKLPTFVSALNPNQTTKPESYSLPLTTTLSPASLQKLWLGTTSVGVKARLPKLRSFSSTICFSLPTAVKERVSSNDEVPKWSSRAIKSFAMGELEARKLKYPTTGTEAILMGILIEGTTLASKFLRSNGVTLFKVREETVKLLGKADMWFFSPEHPALTDEAQRVLDWAFDKKIKSGGSGEITTSHLLLGIWYEVDSPGQKMMATLGFNEEKAKELESLISEPGFIDG